MVSILIQEPAKRRLLNLTLERMPATRGELITEIKKDDNWKDVDFNGRLMTCAQTLTSFAIDGASLRELSTLREAPCIIIAPVKEMRGGHIDYNACPLPSFVPDAKGNFREMKTALVAIRDWNKNRDNELATIAYYYGTMTKAEVARRLKKAIDYVNSKRSDKTPTAPVQEPAQASSPVNPFEGIANAFNDLDARLRRMETLLNSSTPADNNFEERLQEIELRNGIVNDHNIDAYLDRNKELFESIGKLKAALG